MVEVAYWCMVLGVASVTLATVCGSVWISAVLLGRNRETRRIEDGWRRIAEGLHLHHSGRTGRERSFRGLLGGRKLTLTALEHDSGIDWVVRLATWRALPHRKDQPGQLLDGDMEFRLRKVGLQDIVERLEGLLVVLEELEAGVDRPWLEAGAAIGLRADPPIGGMLPTLSGEVDGRAVRMLQREDDLGRFIEIRARWSNPALGALEVARKGVIDDEMDLDNPVLGMLLGTRSDRIEAVVTAFADERLTETLLEVIHGNEGSRVLPGWVVTQTRRGPECASELLAATLRLARMLSG